MTMANEHTIDVTDGNASASTGVASARLREFQSEVSQLKVTGGRANPEKQGLVLGFVLWAAAVVLEVIAYFSSHGTDSALEQRDMIILACFGIALAVIGTGLVVRFALTRYFRYWLVRLIYEDREQTDRIVAALERRS
jgi:hypothetical protein